MTSGGMLRYPMGHKAHRYGLVTKVFNQPTPRGGNLTSDIRQDIKEQIGSIRGDISRKLRPIKINY